MRPWEFGQGPPVDQVGDGGGRGFRVQDPHVRPLGHVLVQGGGQAGQAAGVVRQPRGPRRLRVRQARYEVPQLVGRLAGE